MRYRLKQGDHLLEGGFNSRSEVNTHIEEHLRVGGLDWRVGYLFKSRTDVEPFEVIITKTGLKLKI